MLGKLLKYDVRELFRSTLPLLISMGSIGVVCAALLYFTMSFSETEGFFGALGATISFFGIGILALLVIAVVFEFISVSRYYKSLFTDEGYLNMVIPVKTSTLLFAKTLSVLIFNAIGVIALALSLFIAVLLPTMLYDMNYVSDVGEIVGFFVDLSMSAEVVLFFVGAVFELVYSTVAVLSAITVGSAVVRRRKILGSVLFFFAFSLVKSIVESIVGIIVEGLTVTEAQPTVYTAATTLTRVLLCIAFGTVLCLVNYRILNKKFNIE